MLFGNPVKSPIHGPSALYYPNDPDRWARPAGNTDFCITQKFGPTNVAVEPTQVWPGGEGIAVGTYDDFHQGIDLGNRGCGSYIKAAAKGTVIAVAIDSAGGHYVKIDHGAVGGHHFVTGYWHEATWLVKVGQVVAEGQNIATVGDTGLSSGCHLHWQVWKDGKIVDGWRRLKQNTSVDPDAVVAPATPEADMQLSKYLPLYTITVPKGYNIRSTPSTTGAALRLTSAPEPWSILGTVSGEAVSGNTVWYVRVNGLKFEYVWSGGIAAPVAPAAPVDTTPYSQAQMDAVKASLDAANAKITKAKADLA